jgi:hypothetical protein
VLVLDICSGAMRRLRGRSRSTPAAWRRSRSRSCARPGHSIPFAPEAAVHVAEPTVELLRPVALTEAAIGALVAVRLSDEPHGRFVRECLEATGGNPFLIEELLDEVAARGIDPTAPAAAAVLTIVSHGVANVVLIRSARLAGSGGAGSRAQRARRRRAGAARGTACWACGLRPGVRWRRWSPLVPSTPAASSTSPIRSRAAIHGDLSPAECERMHRAAATILGERGAPAVQVAAHLVLTEPAADPGVVALLRKAAREVMALCDAAAAAALLARALHQPPAQDDRSAVLLELGEAYACAGSPERAGVPMAAVHRALRHAGTLPPRSARPGLRRFARSVQRRGQGPRSRARRARPRKARPPKPRSSGSLVDLCSGA